MSSTSTCLAASTNGIGVAYDYDGSSCKQSSILPQPRISPVAHFISSPNDGIGNDAESMPGLPTSGRLLAVNNCYIAYAVNKGLVRVIDRRSSAKTLLRGHGEDTRIVDAAFFGTEGNIQTKEGVAAFWRELSDRRKLTTQSASSQNLTEPPAAASDILATVGGMNDQACVLIWRIYLDSYSQELTADKLIELRYPLAARILWHPFDPNRFMLLHRNLYDNEKHRGGTHRAVATMVETKRLVTTRHKDDGHMICDCRRSDPTTEYESLTVPGATQLVVSTGSALDSSLVGANDISWSTKDTRHVLTAHDDQVVRLWDVSLPDSSQPGTLSSFQCIARINVSSSEEVSSGLKQVTRVIFLSQYESNLGWESATSPFVTGTDMNHTITLWSGFRNSSDSNNSIDPPLRLRLFHLKTASPPSLSNLLCVEICPAPYRPADTVPSSFLLLAGRSCGLMHALHLDTEWKDGDTAAVVVKGFDYLTTFDVVHPILSISLIPTTSVHEQDGSSSSDEKDIELCCVQTKAVQMLSLSSAMCAPPKNRDGEDLSAGVMLLGMCDDQCDEEDYEEEEYDVEEDVEVDGEYSGDVDVITPQTDYETPAAIGDEANDPFSNWLGAIVNPIPPPSSTAIEERIHTPRLEFILPRPPGLSASLTHVREEMSFLSPMQILSESNDDIGLQMKNSENSSVHPASHHTPRSISSGKKKKGVEPIFTAAKKNQHSQPMAILQREVFSGENRSSSHPSESNFDTMAIDSTFERVLSAQLKSFESRLMETMQKTVATEVESAIVKAMELLLRDAKLTRQLEKAAKDSAVGAVASMQTPIVSAFHQTMKEIMIPAHEAATRQMFHQISNSMDKGMAQIPTNLINTPSPALQAMSVQLTKLAETIQILSAEVAQLRSASSNSAWNNGNQVLPQQTPPAKARPVDERHEILALFQAHRYEEAFAKAVSAANGDIVVFTCKHADISLLLSGQVPLSQTILICLMQQLGAVLVSASDPADFKVIVNWLQEIAVTIDPTDENIKRHVGGVVQQLLSNINGKMSSCEPTLRRPLQTLMQVIRGLL